MSRTSFGLLRDGAHRNRCRIREPGSWPRNPGGVHPTLGTPCLTGPECGMGRGMRRYRGDLFHTTRIHRRIHWQAPCHQRTEERCPLLRRAARIQRYWGCMPRLKGRAPRRCTRRAICWEPMQGPVASVFRQANLRSPIENRCTLTCLSTLPKHLHSWRQFWATPEAHWRRTWWWDLGEAARVTEYTEALIVSGSGGKGSGDWTTVPTCAAFHAPATGALEQPLRRTGRRCGWT